MANGIVSVHAGIYGIGIYAIMLPSTGFSVAHFVDEPHPIQTIMPGQQWMSNHIRPQLL